MSDIDAAKREVAEACRVVANAGLTEIYAGHVSARVGDTALIPAHLHHEGRGMESITPQHVIMIDLNDGSQDPTGLELPEEATIHTRIFEVRDDVTSVVHAHPPHATALSLTAEGLLPASVRAIRIGGPVPIHDAGPRLIEAGAEAPEARGRAVAETLGDAPALLIRGHGVVTVGRTVAEAVGRIYALDRAAQLQIDAASGGEVVPYEGDPYGMIAHRFETPSEDTYLFLRQQYLDERFD